MFDLKIVTCYFKIVKEQLPGCSKADIFVAATLTSSCCLVQGMKEENTYTRMYVCVRMYVALHHTPSLPRSSVGHEKCKLRWSTSYRRAELFTACLTPLCPDRRPVSRG